MTDQSQLAALDAAATKGALVTNGWGNGSTQMGMTNIFNEDAEVLLMECLPETDAELIVVLWNLYRSGDLVMLPSVEEINADLTSAFCENVDDWLEDRIDDCDMGAILSRAVLTSMGAKRPHF